MGLGYKYLNLDDYYGVIWLIQTPNGIKASVDYPYSKGLKFSLYSDGGNYICQLSPGCYRYEEKDGKT